VDHTRHTWLPSDFGPLPQSYGCHRGAPPRMAGVRIPYDFGT
jgi:hypothetical protein